MAKAASTLPLLLLSVLLGGLVSCGSGKESGPAPSGPTALKKVKAGFIYVGPVGDFGWSYGHEQARLGVMKRFSWLETVCVESVPEGDAARIIDRLVREEKCNIIFTTSFGYMDTTLESAGKYPDTVFMHCAGYKRAKNMGTYFAEFHQAYYLNGLMAGALTRSSKIGYVAAQPIPEVIRHINAFTQGIREVNPKATVQVKWINAWYDAGKAREAAEALVAEGCDVLAFTEDSPTVVQVAQKHTEQGHPVYVFSHYSPMQKFGPDCVVSGQLVDWSGIYEDVLMRFHTGIWDNRDYWWLFKEGAVKLGGEPDAPINPKFVAALNATTVNDPNLGKIGVTDLALKRLAQMSEATVLFEPFTGPVKDQNGNARLKPGERANHDMLWSMNWFVEGVNSSIPK